MSRDANSMRPLVRQDFNRAMDRRSTPRAEPIEELYFRDISPGLKAKVWIAEKLYDKN